MDPQELEKVIAQLQEATKDAVQSTKDKLPEAIKALRDLGQENDPGQLAIKSYGILSTFKGESDVGVAVCQVVLSHPEGTKVSNEVGSQMIALRLKESGTNAMGGFLRGGESINGFSRQFIKQTSPDLGNELDRRINVIKDTHREEIESYGNKTNPKIKEINEINTEINRISDGEMRRNKDDKSLSPEQITERNAPLQKRVDELVLKRDGLQKEINDLTTEKEDLQIKLAKKFSQELATPPLTDVSKTYLRSLRDAVVNEPTFGQEFAKQGKGTPEEGIKAQEKIALDLVNNSTSLRYVSPKISTDTEMTNQPVWTSSSQLAITSFNKVNTDSLGTSDKLSARVGAAVHTEESRQRVRDMHESIKQAPLAPKMGLDLPDELNKKQALKPFDDYLKKLEDRKQQLQTKPTFGDHFKAFFKHGLKGVQGEIEHTNLKIEATKIAREDAASGVSVDLRREAVQRLKHNEAALNHEIQQTKLIVAKSNIEKSMGMEPTVSEKQVDDAFKHHDALKPAKEEIGENIKLQEKVLKVREAIGHQPHVPKQGPKQGIHV